jgi:hypothetical protein
LEDKFGLASGTGSDLSPHSSVILEDGISASPMSPAAMKRREGNRGEREESEIREGRDERDEGLGFWEKMRGTRRVEERRAIAKRLKLKMKILKLLFFVFVYQRNRGKCITQNK